MNPMPEEDKSELPSVPKPAAGNSKEESLPLKPSPVPAKPSRTPARSYVEWKKPSLEKAAPWMALAAVALLTGPFLALAIRSHLEVESLRRQLNQSTEENQFLHEETTRLKSIADRLKKESENRHSRLKATEVILGKAEEIELAHEQRDLAEKRERQRLEELRDQVAGDLAATISPERLSVALEGGILVIRLTGKGLFENITQLTAEGRETLKTLADLFKTQLKDHPVQVEAHSDRVPIGEYLKSRYPSNTSLSAARAAAIADFLATEGAVPATRLTASGRGEAFPLDWGTGAEADDKNRRVEFRVNTQVPNPKIQAPAAEPVPEIPSTATDTTPP
jgi:chemotaxis protein MotB